MIYDLAYCPACQTPAALKLEIVVILITLYALFTTNAIGWFPQPCQVIDSVFVSEIGRYVVVEPAV